MFLFQVRLRGQRNFWNIFLGVCIVTVVFILPIISAFSPQLRKNYCSSQAEVRRQNYLPQCAVSGDEIENEGSYHNGVDVDGNFLDEELGWFDPEFAAIGQDYARRNAFGVYYAMFMSYVFFVGDKETRRVIINTGKSTTPEGAAKRYLSNFLQVELWFNQDLRNNVSRANFFESLHHVRSRHIRAGHKAEENKANLQKPMIPRPRPGDHKIDSRIWDAFEADLRASHLNKYNNVVENTEQKSKLLFNQYSMAIAHFLHFGLVITKPEKVFVVKGTPTEEQAFLHLWALIGKAVGVEDQYNLALQPDIKTARVNLKKFFNENMVPSLFKLDYEAKYMFDLLFQGLNNAFSRTPNEKRFAWNNLGDIFLLRLLEDILEIPAPNMRAVLTPFEQGYHAALRALVTRYKTPRYQAVGNGLITRLFQAWAELKFNLDTKKPNEVASKGFV